VVVLQIKETNSLNLSDALSRKPIYSVSCLLGSDLHLPHFPDGKREAQFEPRKDEREDAWRFT
jgi:hypothetical protein